MSDDPPPSPSIPDPSDERANRSDLLRCEVTGERLDKPGALLFSPPLADGTVRKHHISAEVYDADIIDLLAAAMDRSVHLDAPRETCSHGVTVGFVCHDCSVAARRTVVAVAAAARPTSLPEARPDVSAVLAHARNAMEWVIGLDGFGFKQSPLHTAIEAIDGLAASLPEAPEPSGLRPAKAEDVIAEVERRLRDTDWSSHAEDRCRVALMHIDAWREGRARAAATPSAPPVAVDPEAGAGA